jgi:hypothetical protein
VLCIRVLFFSPFFRSIVFLTVFFFFAVQPVGNTHFFSRKNPGSGEGQLHDPVGCCTWRKRINKQVPIYADPPPLTEKEKQAQKLAARRAAQNKKAGAKVVPVAPPPLKLIGYRTEVINQFVLAVSDTYNHRVQVFWLKFSLKKKIIITIIFIFIIYLFAYLFTFFFYMFIYFKIFYLL